MTKLYRFALFVLFASVSTLAAAPVPSSTKYDPPSAIGQVASIRRVIDTVVGYTKAFSPESADAIEQGLAGMLGEKGWAGVDTTKPIGMFSYVNRNLGSTYIVFAVPVTKDEETLDLLSRLGFSTDEDAKLKGLYTLTHPGFLPEGALLRMRFHAGYAYIGVNAAPADLDAAKLLPVGNLVDEKETALLATTIYPGRLPGELKEVFDGWWASGRAGLDQLANQAPNDMPRGFPSFAKACVGWIDANTAALFKDAETLKVRFTPDAKTTDSGLELIVTPKAKTQLAADVEKLATPTAGRFHQIVTKDAVGGLTATLGTGLPKEVRQTAGQFLADWIKLYEPSVPEEVQPAVAFFAQTVNRMLADGKTDLGFALLGPDKNGTYTAVGAVTVDDSAAFEKTVRQMVKDAPKELQDMVKLDAEKVGEMSVHTVTLTDRAELMFGKKATLRLAFGKDAVYVAAGPDGQDELKRAVALKPTVGKRFDLLMNPAKLNKLIGDDEGVGSIIGTLIGKEEGLRSFTGIEVKGGKQLTITMTQHRTGLLVGLFGSAFFFLF